MKKFITKFDVSPFEGCVMNPYDAVDRLSYVDSTVQIVRMLQAGVNLRMRASQGMQDIDLNAPSTVVYAPDVSVAQRMLNDLDAQLKENAAIRTAEFEAKNAENVEPAVTPLGDD